MIVLEKNVEDIDINEVQSNKLKSQEPLDKKYRDHNMVTRNP